MLFTIIKSVFILVRCNTLLSKNYVENSVTVVCVMALWLSVHIA